MASHADSQHRYPIFSTDARAALGLKLAQLRKKSGRSQRRLGLETGISSSRLSRIERGRFLPSLEELGRLREALCFDVEVIVFGRSVASSLGRLAGVLETVSEPGELAVVEQLLESLIQARSGGVREEAKR
jgi:transcriptional regulator with XRE-family HTH domain